MLDRDFDRLLEQAVFTVLENMFFSSPLGRADAESSATDLEAGLRFRGPFSGTFIVRISAAGVRTLAAGFLGEEEDALTPAQPGQVVCELANMLCGWLISNLEDERFVLEPPELNSTGSQTVPSAPPAAQRSFAIENGILTVSLHETVPA